MQSEAAVTVAIVAKACSTRQQCGGSLLAFFRNVRFLEV
jgi:hypothetical protein